jgi:stringent starvation protein B
MPTQPLPPKKEVALALLERSSVFVHLDPRIAAVIVPPGFKKQPQLVLQVGLNMPVPIRDLNLDDDGMTCTLSFNRTPFFCIVPWSSVYAIVGCDDGRGMIWPDDVPPEVAQAQARAVESVDRKGGAKPPQERASAAISPKAKRARKRPALGAVPDVDENGSGTAARHAPAVAPAPALGSSSGNGSPQRPVISPAPVRRAAEATGRRKRELPPYLRVVK